MDTKPRRCAQREKSGIMIVRGVISIVKVVEAMGREDGERRRELV